MGDALGGTAAWPSPPSSCSSISFCLPGFAVSVPLPPALLRRPGNKLLLFLNTLVYCRTFFAFAFLLIDDKARETAGDSGMPDNWARWFESAAADSLSLISQNRTRNIFVLDPWSSRSLLAAVQRTISDCFILLKEFQKLSQYRILCTE